ncbi:hypothetical protein ATERTT37_007678 [Aspergillus terreus]
MQLLKILITTFLAVATVTGHPSPEPETIVEFQPLSTKDVVYSAPRHDIHCGGNNPQGKTYNGDHIWETTVAAFQRIKNGTHVPEKNGWPKKYLWNDKIQFKNVLGCSESNENWEFPILEHGIFDGNNAKLEEVDRVVIRRIGKREMAYCGLVTHLDAPKPKNPEKGKDYYAVCEA